MVTIREYRTTDKDDVMELNRRNTPEYFAAEEEIDVSECLEREIELYYGMVTSGRVVGCGGRKCDDEKPVGKISWDIIHPDYQGKSLGKQLLEYRIDKLKSFDRVRKITVRTSQLVYKFYQKQGFVLKATHKDYWAKGIDWSMKEIRTPLYFKM